MNEIKGFIVRLIVLSFLIQVCGMFIRNSSLKKLYNLICGIILICTILNIPITDMGFSFALPEDEFSYEESQFDVKRDFTDKVSQKIKNDLSTQYGFSGSVEVQSDFRNLNIIVYGAEDYEKEVIKKYIKDKYCTEKDRVEFSSEIKR